MDRTQRLVLDQASALRISAQHVREHAGDLRRQNARMRARLAEQRARAQALRDQQPRRLDVPRR